MVMLPPEKVPVTPVGKPENVAPVAPGGAVCDRCDSRIHTDCLVICTGGGSERDDGGMTHLRHKNIPPASLRRLESPRCNIVVGGVSGSRHIGVAAPIHRYGIAPITHYSPRCRWNRPERCPPHSASSQKHPPPASICRLESPRCNIVVGGESISRHIGVAAPIHRYAIATIIITTPPDVGGIDQSGACRIQLRHKNIPPAFYSSSGKPPVSHRSRWR
jgi:hypothetical protein